MSDVYKKAVYEALSEAFEKKATVKEAEEKKEAIKKEAAKKEEPKQEEKEASEVEQYVDDAVTTIATLLEKADMFKEAAVTLYDELCKQAGIESEKE